MEYYTKASSNLFVSWRTEQQVEPSGRAQFLAAAVAAATAAVAVVAVAVVAAAVAVVAAAAATVDSVAEKQPLL